MTNSHIAYKAFNEDLSCKGFQYEIGGVYSIEKGTLKMCVNGFHCCRDILNCLEYYEKLDSRFCEVEIGEESITENGKTVTSTIRILRELGKKEIEERLTGEVKHSNWNRIWYKNGKIHRDGDLPAREVNNGYKEWYKNGKLHRDGDLPAIDDIDGYKAWYKDDKQHRDGDLPAVENANGDKEWWKNDKQHRDGDLPAVEYANGDKEWWKNGKQHRDGDLPAVEYANGDKEWWKNGKRLPQPE